MSHTMNIKIEIHDIEALKAACERLSYKFLGHGSFKLYGSYETGLGVDIGMKYPAVIKVDGSVSMDDYDWSRHVHTSWETLLNPLQAAYGIEKAKIEALKQGYNFFETVNEETQELELRIQVGEE